MHNVSLVISQAWRSWKNAKGVALLAAAALAAGIGSATAIYTVVNAVMLKPLPYRDGDRFVALFGSTFNDPEHYSSLSFDDAQAYKERTRAFDAFGWRATPRPESIGHACPGSPTRRRSYSRAVVP